MNNKAKEDFERELETLFRHWHNLRDSQDNFESFMGGQSTFLDAIILDVTYVYWEHIRTNGPIDEIEEHSRLLIRIGVLIGKHIDNRNAGTLLAKEILQVIEKIKC